MDFLYSVAYVSVGAALGGVLSNWLITFLKWVWNGSDNKML
jgi:hypothetical protein